jgi:hypothetical protein
MTEPDRAALRTIVDDHAQGVERKRDTLISLRDAQAGPGAAARYGCIEAPVVRLAALERVATAARTELHSTVGGNPHETRLALSALRAAADKGDQAHRAGQACTAVDGYTTRTVTGPDYPTTELD